LLWVWGCWGKNLSFFQNLVCFCLQN
jgi:hypothetical protein